MRRFLFAVVALCCATHALDPQLLAAATVARPLSGAWQPASGRTQLPIWPGTPPSSIPTSGPEDWGHAPERGGPSWIYVGNVTNPTITVYSPKGRNSGAAIVVFPGGGYTVLAIDLEGTEICDWVTSRGMTCVLLKYRVPGGLYYPKSAPFPKSGPYPFAPLALQDAQRALGLIRLRAAEWHIDPHKIGVIGFSAGGHLVAAVSNHFRDRVYPPVDRADEQSCRPDFAILLYPGHLTLAAVEEDARFGHREFVPPAAATGTAAEWRLNPDIAVTSETPPSFLLQAEDDRVDDVRNTLVYFAALKEAHVPAEMHIYPRGGHAFGLRRTKEPITAWPHLVEQWLQTLGMIPK